MNPNIAAPTSLTHIIEMSSIDFFLYTKEGDLLRLDHSAFEVKKVALRGRKEGRNCVNILGIVLTARFKSLHLSLETNK